jgi:hypothetical protein
MSSSPRSCRAFRSISLRSISVRGSVVNLLFYLVDQLLRGCQSMDNQVQASGAKSRSSSNPAFCTTFFFSGSAGFGTWRIFVPLFSATYRLFSIFLLFLNFRTFCLWILYILFTLILLRHQGRVFYYCGLSILCLPFVSLRQKGGVIC